MDVIRQFLVICNDEYTTLISKFVLVSTLLDHRPGQTGVCRKEGFTFLYFRQPREVDSVSMKRDSPYGASVSPTDPTAMTYPGAVDEKTLP